VLVISDLGKAITPTAIALGNFDGVHRGHQRVIMPAIAPAEGLVSTVLTFNPHPQEFFTGTTRLLLTPIAEKIEQLSALGVQQLVLLPFNRAIAALTPQEFMQQILIDQLQAQQISVGFNFRFGCKRCGSVEDLKAMWGDRLNIVPEQLMHDALDHKDGDAQVRISSSAIRAALAQGDIDTAHTLLGRPYSLMGQVVAGQQMGRKLGFPTANLNLDPQKFLPRDGVYAVQVMNLADTPLMAVMNIGVRPTVTGDRVRTVEVHLLNWSGDLYGQELCVHLAKFLRPEQKFDSLDALKQQIKTDCEIALSDSAASKPYFSDLPSYNIEP
jgi:riboflavin kinase / FMN adenylyltransferase